MNSGHCWLTCVGVVDASIWQVALGYFSEVSWDIQEKILLKKGFHLMTMELLISA